MELLKLENITKKFTDGTTELEVLKPTNLVVDANQFIAIIGPSGSGKSTLLTILGLLQKPTSGSVYINGRDVTQVKEKDKEQIRFNEIGFIFQSSNLIPFLTVKDQFKLIQKLSKKTLSNQSQELFKKLEIDSLMNKHIQKLSGGQRQRVGIARALYNEPTIVLADEPTASLDSEKAFEVVKILSELSKTGNRSVIMVTHDQRMIEKCDAVYQMKDGVLTQIR